MLLPGTATPPHALFLAMHDTRLFSITLPEPVFCYGLLPYSGLGETQPAHCASTFMTPPTAFTTPHGYLHVCRDVLFFKLCPHYQRRISELLTYLLPDQDDANERATNAF